MDDVVRVSSVTKSYEPDSRALDDVSLRIGAAEAVAVIGPSGSGKSTLLNLVGGLDRPDTGTLEVAGQDLGRLSETALARFRREHIGIVFQFFNLLDDLTVRDNILLPAQLRAGRRGRENTRAGTRADSLIEALGIGQRARAYPGQLSGGERQRVAVARALINEPVLLLADEPTGAVDRGTGRYVAGLLAELAVAGQALLLVTHDLELASTCTSREVVVTDGRIQSGDLESTVRVQS